MKPNWRNRDWAYLLGVIHGDGHVSKRSVSVSVSHHEPQYVRQIVSAFKTIGFSPKVYRCATAFRVDVHNTEFSDEIKKYKANGLWKIPDGINAAQYVSGVIDTDGCVASPKTKRIILVLKASGNAELVRQLMTGMGIPRLKVIYKNTKYKGKPYPIEQLLICGVERICKIAPLLRLRHPRKRKRLALMLANSAAIRDHRPMWYIVGEWISKCGPRNWKQICNKFKLSKRQFDSIMLCLKRYAHVTVIPPPETFTRYQVSGLSYFRDQ